MTQQQIIWAIVAVVVAIVAIILIRAMTRRQQVTFDATAPTPPPLARTIDPRPVAPPAPPPPSAAPVGDGAELTKLKGLGPKAASRLAELGITEIAALAALSDADTRVIDEQMGPFQGRFDRDRWREQARLLAAGDIAAYEAQYGKLGG
ncbi:hypothetical protein PQ455_00445 [Sphingomonas naphthae]|uniref:Flap endonuclease-1-like 5' DNA nuclease n=1 Tax=Sphingomonas naphthae TaxID=1813468 RepID=A0ABY7TLU8_9SPHN|nr:hypothetical protein [Sphingomonas naphthae]WCT73736.1 hypothetical protein PQ455_00445 [Sphingomonas naphthae]